MKRERILILIDDSGTCDKIGIIMEKILQEIKQ